MRLTSVALMVVPIMLTSAANQAAGQTITIPLLGTEVTPPVLPAPVQPGPVRPAVLTGAEVLLRDSLRIVQGLRVGLITNHTAVNREGRHTIELLHEHPEVGLTVLFSPEHGLRGDAD